MSDLVEPTHPAVPTAPDTGAEHLDPELWAAVTRRGVSPDEARPAEVTDLFTLSDNGRIFAATGDFATLLGYTPSELNERRLVDLVFLRDRAQIEALVARPTTATRSLDCRYLQSDGESIYIQTVIDRIEKGWRVAGIETTDFRGLLRERRDLRTRLELAVSPAGAAMWDLTLPDGRFTWDVDAAELLGVTPDGLPTGIEELVPLVAAADQDGLRSALNRLISEGTGNTVIRVGAGPSTRYLSFRGRVLDGQELPNPHRAVGLLLDVTLDKALEEQLLRLSVSDGLTGIRNRRGFDQTLRGEWRRCAREGAPLSIVMIDVDHFKSFNDTHGHLSGDQALVAIARALSDALAGHEEPGVARYGGEEFGVILPGVDAAEAQEIVGQLLSAVETVRLHQTPDWRFTVSAGLASATPGVDGVKATSVLRDADRALYSAKHGGRGRMSVHGVDTPATTAA